jgi:hypothetical protein
LPECSSLAFLCVGPHRNGAGSKRRGRGSLPRLARYGRGARTARRWWTEVATGVPRREGARGAEVRKGGEQRAQSGEVETGARFVGVGWWWWGGETVGQAAAEGVLLRHWLHEGETTGQRRFIRKFKRSQWRVGSAPYRCERASISSGRSGSASRGWRLGLWPEEEDDSGGSEMGRVHLAQRPTGPVSWETEKNGGGPHEGMGRNQRIKKNGLFKWF